MWRNRLRRRGASVDDAATGRVVYRSWMSDNLRWDALALREGDIVISAPPGCGNTWTQRLVSLLVFDGPDLPGPMASVSPWLDFTIRPIQDVVSVLDAQDHRRFIKTHTALDGLVLDDRVTYIGVGRDPRDAAVSMLHQGTNLDRNRMRALYEAAVPPHERIASRPDLDHEPSPLEALRDWLERPVMPTEGMTSLASILHHFGSVWQRRHLPNVALFHYADYQTDLAGELTRLGHVLGYDLSRDRAEELAKHAGLDAMRARASELTPGANSRVWRSNDRFFGAGGGSKWGTVFTEHENRRYVDRAKQLAPQDLLVWAHYGRPGHNPAIAM